MFNRKTVITECNYQNYLPPEYIRRSDLSYGDIQRINSLSGRDTKELLSVILSVFTNKEEWDSDEAAAFSVAIMKRFKSLSTTAMRQKEVDDAVAAALAKRDQEKPVAPVSDAADPRTIKNVGLKSMSLNRDGGVDYERAEVCNPNPLISAAFSAMINGFLTIDVPRDATQEQCRSWARDGIGTLRLINKDHPVLKKIEAEIEQHRKDVADKAKMQGVIAEMVRPSSIVKPKKPTSSKKI